MAVIEDLQIIDQSLIMHLLQNYQLRTEISIENYDRQSSRLYE